MRRLKWYHSISSFDTSDETHLFPDEYCNYLYWDPHSWNPRDENDTTYIIHPWLRDTTIRKRRCRLICKSASQCVQSFIEGRVLGDNIWSWYDWQSFLQIWRSLYHDWHRNYYLQILAVSRTLLMSSTSDFLSMWSDHESWKEHTVSENLDKWIEIIVAEGYHER